MRYWRVPSEVTLSGDAVRTSAASGTHTTHSIHSPPVLTPLMLHTAVMVLTPLTRVTLTR